MEPLLLEEANKHEKCWNTRHRHYGSVLNWILQKWDLRIWFTFNWVSGRSLAGIAGSNYAGAWKFIVMRFECRQVEVYASG